MDRIPHLILFAGLARCLLTFTKDGEYTLREPTPLIRWLASILRVAFQHEGVAEALIAWATNIEPDCDPTPPHPALTEAFQTAPTNWLVLLRERIETGYEWVLRANGYPEPSALITTRRTASQGTYSPKEALHEEVLNILTWLAEREEP